jgi:thiamine-phosphate pyrophosphorylase
VASPDLLREARREIDLPLVAIGGITAHNSAKLLEAGADALAVITAVFGADDIQAVAQQFSNFKYPETGTKHRKTKHDFAKSTSL